jgi:hypothetical protein
MAGVPGFVDRRQIERRPTRVLQPAPVGGTMLLVEATE